MGGSTVTAGVARDLEGPDQRRMRAHPRRENPNHRQADVLIDGTWSPRSVPGSRPRRRAGGRDRHHRHAGLRRHHRRTSMSLFRNLGEADGVRSGISPASAAFEALSAGRRVRRDPHRVARCRRSGDHHRRRLVQRGGGRRPRRRRVAGPRRRRPSHRVRSRSLLGAAGHGAAGRRRAQDIVARLAGLAGPATRIASGSVVAAASDVPALANEWSRVREAGLRIRAHAGPKGWERGVISEMAEAGLLGDDVTLAHLPPRRRGRDALAASGASVTMAPSSEMAAGLGPPRSSS